MLPSIQSQDREIFSMIIELAKALRCCRQDEVFCAGEVTFSQFVILDAVAGRGTLDMAGLHKLLSVDKSTTTRLIAPLIGRRLLVRERASLDSRAAMLTLTGEGKAVHKKALQSLKSLIEIIREEIPAEKRDACLEGSRLFLQALQRCFDGRPKGRKGFPAANPVRGQPQSVKPSFPCGTKRQHREVLCFLTSPVKSAEELGQIESTADFQHSLF